LYAGIIDYNFVQALFYGIKPAIMAIVVQAVFKIGKRALKNEVMVLLSVMAFIAIFFLDVPFPIIVIGAGLIGFLGRKVWEEKFYIVKGHDVTDEENKDENNYYLDRIAQPLSLKPSWKKGIKTLVFWLVLWFLPLGILVATLGPNHIFVAEGIFFSKTAVVTF